MSMKVRTLSFSSYEMACAAKRIFGSNFTVRQIENEIAHCIGECYLITPTQLKRICRTGCF